MSQKNKKLKIIYTVYPWNNGVCTYRTVWDYNQKCKLGNPCPCCIDFRKMKSIYLHFQPFLSIENTKYNVIELFHIEGKDMFPCIDTMVADVMVTQRARASAAMVLAWLCWNILLFVVMMTSSNGNIFHVTGHLCGVSSVTSEFPAQRLVTRSFDVFFDLPLNKWLSKQLWGWWFEMPSCPLWCHCNGSARTIPYGIRDLGQHWLT